jgi:alpha-galactosidase/6-phospho-beta-glucosidase family protein
MDGIKTAGFCSNSSQVLEAAGQILLGIHETFPWPEASRRFVVEMAGVNHFTWLLRLADRATGADLTAQFTAALLQGEAGIAQQRPMSMDMLRSFGLYPPNGDGHMADFVPPTGQVKSVESNTHGTAEEREARLNSLKSIAAGETRYRLEHRAWEMPMDFVAAIAQGESIRFNSLNLANANGQLPQLPPQVFVETAVSAQGGHLTPSTHILPDKVAAACRATAEVTDALTNAAVHHDRKLLSRTVELDPTILDKHRATQALDACLKAHADLIGTW